MRFKLLLEPIHVILGILKYSKTFDFSLGETMVSLGRSLFCVWLGFPALAPIYVFFPSLLEDYKEKFTVENLMSFYNSPFYWSHLVVHEFSEAKREYVKHIIELIMKLGGTRRLRILDVGSGIGSYTVHLSRLGEVTYLDISRKSLHLTKQRSKVNASGILASAEFLPVADASFDMAICLDILEHIAEPRGVIDAIMTVLGSEDSYLVANYDISCPERDHIGRLTRTEFEASIAQEFCISEFIFEVGSPVYVISKRSKHLG